MIRERLSSSEANRHGREHRKASSGESTSRCRSSVENHQTHQRSRQAKDLKEEHPTRGSDKARSKHRESLGRHSHRHSSDAGSESSDEVLIKQPTSHSSRRHKSKDVDKDKDSISYQLKNIEKAQREALRSSSSSSGEIQVHYIPIITKSNSPPLAESRQSQSRSLETAASNPMGVKRTKSISASASELTSQIKDFTRSLIARRRSSSSKSPPLQRGRSRHEKLGKHGKKKQQHVSKYIDPLSQQWVCYGCGKLRSSNFHSRHALKRERTMHPNWCDKCRSNSELNKKPLEWRGQRHYCWGCGIVRSKEYHEDNPLKEGELPTPNFCRPCRQLSPSYDCKLREVSEVGSEASIRVQVSSVRDRYFSIHSPTRSHAFWQALQRQMHNAKLSDVAEDENKAASTASAQGKENVDPKLHKPAMGTKASTLRDGSSFTMTRSNSSPESSASEPHQKALPKIRKHRDTGEEGPRPSRGSHGSYSSARPSKSCSDMAATAQDEAEDSPSKNGRDEDDQHDRDVGKVKKERNGRSSPSKRLSAEGSIRSNSSGASKKKVHWPNEDQQKGDQQQEDQKKDSQKEDQQTSTAESSLPTASNVNPSRGSQPDKSKRSNAPRGRRHRDPARTSTGSPNEEDFARLDDTMAQNKDRVTGDGGVSGQSSETAEHVSGTGHSEDKNGGTTCSPPDDKTPEKEPKSIPSEVPNADSATAPGPFDMPSAAGHQESFEDQSAHGYWNPYDQMPGYNPYTSGLYGPGHSPYNHYTASEPFPGSSYPYGFNNHPGAYASHRQYGHHHDYFAGYDNIHNNKDAHDFPGAPTTTDFEFDFSGFDQPTSNDMNGADAEDGGPVPEMKKFTRLNKNKSKSAPSLSSVVGTWEMYDDGDDRHGHVDAEHNKSADF